MQNSHAQLEKYAFYFIGYGFKIVESKQVDLKQWREIDIIKLKKKLEFNLNGKRTKKDIRQQAKQAIYKTIINRLRINTV